MGFWCGASLACYVPRNRSRGPFATVLFPPSGKTRREIWRSKEKRRRPRVEFLLDLKENLGGRASAQHLLGEARPNFLRSVGFDLDPMVLRLRKAVVDLRRNFAQGRMASDYTSKLSQVRAPGEGLGDPGGHVESAKDSEARKCARDLPWIIFKKGETSEYRPPDRKD